MFSKTQRIGHLAEKKAQRYLELHGLRLWQKNFSCRYGEIDLIMIDQHTLVFVEVRYRASARYGSGIETIQRNKQRRLQRAALYYLQSNQLTNQLLHRFDVVGITKDQKITWIKDAFTVEY